MVYGNYFHTPVSHLHDPAYYAGVLGNGREGDVHHFSKNKILIYWPFFVGKPYIYFLLLVQFYKICLGEWF